MHSPTVNQRHSSPTTKSPTNTVEALRQLDPCDAADSIPSGKDVDTAPTPARLDVRRLPRRARPHRRALARDAAAGSDAAGRQARLLPVDGVPHRPRAGQRLAGHRSLRRSQAAPARSWASTSTRWSSSSPTRRWATAAWAGWRPASSTRWPRSACPASATASATSTACSPADRRRPAGRGARLLAGRRQSVGVPAPRAALHGALRRPGDHATRTTLRCTGSTPRTCSPWPTTPSSRATAPTSVNTLRLWAAQGQPGDRPRGLQPRRLHAARWRPRTSPRTSRRVLYPDDSTEPAASCGCGRSISSSARRMQDLLRRYLRNARQLRRACPTRWRST